MTALKKLKDSTEVATAELDSLPAKEQFEALVEAAARELGALPNVVAEAIFYDFRGETLPIPGFGEDDKRKEIDQALGGSSWFRQAAVQ